MAAETVPKKLQLAWSPEEKARLIHLRGQNPDITWTEFHKRYPFPNRTPTSVFQCYRRYTAPEGGSTKRKRRRERDDNGGSNTTKRGRYGCQNRDEEIIHSEDYEDEDEVGDTEETGDEEWTDDDAGDIGFNGTVSPLKRGSPCTKDHTRHIPNPKHTDPEHKPPITYTARRTSTGDRINPRFVAARTIHSVDPSPKVHLGFETSRSRFNSIETAAVNAREEARKTKEDIKKMQEDIKKIQEDASKDKKTLTGIVSWLGNLKMVDLFRMIDGVDDGDLKVVSPSESGDGSKALLTRTPECDSGSEHLRAWSG